MGVIRDRTAKFLEFRQRARHTRPRQSAGGAGDQVGLLDGGDDVAIELPEISSPHWVQVVETIHSGMETLKGKMDELVQMHEKFLLPGFGDRKQEEQKIEVLTRSITSVFAKMQSHIKTVTQPQPGEKVSEKEATARRNVQASLAMALQELSLKFRRDQKHYLDRLQASERRTKENINRLGVSALHEPAAPVLPADADGFSQVLIDTLDTQDEIIRDRENQIKQLARSVQELNEMFRDLAQLVVEQGTLLDRIDANLETAKDNVEEAVDELGKAKEEQSRFRCWICILLLILLIAGMAVILVIRLVPRGS